MKNRKIIAIGLVLCSILGACISAPTSTSISAPTAVPTLTSTFVLTAVPALTSTFVPTAVPTLTSTFVPTAVPTLTSTFVPTVVPTLTSVPKLTSTLLPTSIPMLKTSAEVVTAAWSAFNSSRFSEAVNFAQECIGRWEYEANKQQSALTQAPPNGKVTDDEKQAISANWALNDVGTAYFIKARAFEMQGKLTEAIESYEKSKTFPFARCWDPANGWFWSPADGAVERLGKIQ